MLYSLGVIASALAGLTVVLGGIVEGYGYGLSLGTKWPYTRDIHHVAMKGDPEALHRISATIVGLISLAFLIMSPSFITVVGFIAVIFTALLGMATLYVLAGKLPSVFQGLHDIAAYTVFVTYLLIFLQGLGYNINIIAFLEQAIIPPHFLYFVIFMGGVVTGLRRMSRPIGQVRKPQGRLQWAWAIHGVLAVIFILAVLYLHYWLTLGFTALEITAGLWVYRSINKNPEKPGASIGFHQLFSLLTVVAIILNSLAIVP
ncbi:cytochrome C oxidase assembly protein [Metallosphaera tengchongensis]|uniref:Cytochrome C oxidase assembly protein n=1 Tax=Metallosphaera tengchongensis TaxID=1532350 RepID=A0A6N0NY52_9CREN|nr:cytochrome C oxidase assembly protein [Metallosphaera tengchongensis]QKR00051.1 cytochrome C oxidase assembly protein [Metallosphaera tengchongensis]